MLRKVGLRMEGRSCEEADQELWRSCRKCCLEVHTASKQEGKSGTRLQLQPRPAFILLTERLAVSGWFPHEPGLPVYLSRFLSSASEDGRSARRCVSQISLLILGYCGETTVLGKHPTTEWNSLRVLGSEAQPAAALSPGASAERLVRWWRVCGDSRVWTKD
ncbi:hypothetical protein MHYP_G00347370 [Metynnis hypsauchen]